LVRAFRRSLMGGSTVNPPSRFLNDIPRHLVSVGTPWQREESLAAALSSWNRPSPAPVPAVAIPELKAGDHVRHETFGDGIVVSFKKVKDDTEVAVAFKGVGVKKLSLSFARLEKVE